MNPKEREGNKRNAVITIYFSLCLGIILSFILTTIEVARINTAGTYLNRVLQTSMESVLCDYYLPLFEEYHLFGLNVGAGTVEDKKDMLKEKVVTRMNDSLVPEGGPLLSMWNQSSGNFLMCNPEIQEAQVSNLIPFHGEACQYAKKQMTSYMKYQAPMALLEKIMDALDLIKKTETTSETVKQKIVLQMKTLEIDQLALELMEMIEGIKTDKTGLEFTCFLKNLDHTESFIKQIVGSTPTMQSVRIGNQHVFEELEEEYMQFPLVLDQLILNGESLMEKAAVIRKGMEKKAKGKLTKKELKNLQKQNEEYEQNCYMNRIIGMNLTSKVTQIDQLITLALIKIEELEGKRADLHKEYADYCMQLEIKKNQLPEDLMDELAEEDELLDTYTDSKISTFSIICDLEQMKSTLLWNQSILKKVSNVPLPDYSVEQLGYEEWKKGITTWREQLYQLRMEGLEFNYCGLDTGTESKQIFGMVTDMISQSFTETLVGKENISEEKLVKQGLVSNQLGLAPGITEEYTEKKNLGQLMDGGISLGDMKIEDLGMVNDIAERLLLCAYVQEHLENYTSTNQEENYGLVYEQEYIIAGRDSDAKNFASVVSYILAFRTIMNIISVLSDSTKVQKAQKTAELMVGWIPLAGIVQVVQYIILIYWGYCEAAVETAALLRGHDVPIYTKKSDFVVEYGELIQISDSYLEDKASNYECSSKLTLNYSEYIFLILLFVPEINLLSYSLDMVQENIRYEYEDDFYLCNCVISFGMQLKANMETKFFFLPSFMNQPLTPKGYTLKAANSVIY